MLYACFALYIHFKPSKPIPWKEYGEVLGLYAPPRSIQPPASFTSFAMRIIDSSPSTEQGPPITTIFSFPPTLIPSTSITESNGWNKRFAFLYGAAILFTLST